MHYTNSLSGQKTFEEHSLPSNYLATDRDIIYPKNDTIKYKTRDHYIFVSSSHRDSTGYSHYDYRINLEKEYKNVKCVQMVTATIPNTTNILQEPLLIFDIDELNFIDFGKGSSAYRAFSIVPLSAPNKTTNGFISPDLGNTIPKNVFVTPVASLNSLTVKVRNVDGSIYDFGAPVGTTDKAFQHSFLLKITSEEISQKSIPNLSYRNVF
jgi:hypothetical protein